MDTKHDIKHQEAEALPIYTSGEQPHFLHHRKPSVWTRTRKALFLGAVSFLLLLSVHKGFGFGGHGLSEFREGLDMIRHSGGRNRWEGLGIDEVGGEDNWKAVEHHEHHHSELSLDRSPLDLTSNFASIPIDNAHKLVIHALDQAHARVVFEVSSSAVDSVPQITIEREESSTASEDAVIEQIDGHHEEIAGLVISSAAKESYVITVTLPTEGQSKPISFAAHGNLVFDTLNLAAYDFHNFVVVSSVGSEVAINDLNARSANVKLASGGISGSFNVSGELVLITHVGDINANITLLEGHHPECKKGKKGGKRHGKKGDWKKHGQDELDGPPESPAPPPGPPGRPGPPRPPRGPPGPHGPPAVRIFTKTQIGSINLHYTEESKISNHTALFTKSIVEIGNVNVEVAHGFKGVFVEGSRIGEVSYHAVDPAHPVKIIKEVLTGPGSFLKGLVGPHPPPPPHHHDHGKHNGSRHDHDHHHKKSSDESESDESESTVSELIEDAIEKDGRPKGPGGPPPPPPGRPGPPGGPDGHPPPPPGYGFVGAFTSTGEVTVHFQ